jgi:hypothetical protein
MKVGLLNHLSVCVSPANNYINNPNPLLNKVHLTTLNVDNFKMVEAVGLIISSRSPWMASHPNQIPW